jgi:hypothetical protein
VSQEVPDNDAAGGVPAVHDGGARPYNPPTQALPSTGQHPGAQFSAAGPGSPPAWRGTNATMAAAAKKRWWTIPKVVIAGAVAVLLSGGVGGAVGYGIGHESVPHHGFGQSGQLRYGHGGLGNGTIPGQGGAGGNGSGNNTGSGSSNP